eukprot:00613.XXX_2880_980_1 [CDS] Oithona nana genome sequencing.
MVFQNLESTLDVAETEEVTSEPEMIEAESKLDETMEVKPESVELTTEPEMNEAELDAVAEVFQELETAFYLAEKELQIELETKDPAFDTYVTKDEETLMTEAEAQVIQNLEMSLYLSETMHKVKEPKVDLDRGKNTLEVMSNIQLETEIVAKTADLKLTKEELEVIEDADTIEMVTKVKVKSEVVKWSTEPEAEVIQDLELPVDLSEIEALNKPEMKDAKVDLTKNEETIEAGTDVEPKMDTVELTAESGMSLSETNAEAQVMEEQSDPKNGSFYLKSDNIDNRSELSFVLGDFGDAFAPIASVEDFSTLISSDTETNSFASLGEENIMSSTEALNSNGYDEHLPEEIVPNKNDITELQSNPESVDQIEQEEEKYEFPDVGKKTKMRGFGNKMKTILKLKTSKPDLSHAQTTPSTPIVLYTGINVWENVKVEESGSDSHGKTDGKQETSNRILAVEEKLIVDFEKAFQDFSQPENEEDSSEELEKVDGEVKFQKVYSEAKALKYEESAMEETNRESFTFE